MRNPSHNISLYGIEKGGQSSLRLLKLSWDSKWGYMIYMIKDNINYIFSLFFMPFIISFCWSQWFYPEGGWWGNLPLIVLVRVLSILIVSIGVDYNSLNFSYSLYQLISSYFYSFLGSCWEDSSVFFQWAHFQSLENLLGMIYIVLQRAFQLRAA